MNWTLREKTKKEIDDMKNMMRGYKNYNPEVCPLEVTKSNGEVKDVWDLSENEIGGLIEQISREYEKGNKDQTRTAWAGQIISCWQSHHVSGISPRTAAGLFRLKATSKAPVDDFMGSLGSNVINNAKVIAKYLNGMNGNMQSPTDAQVLQVLENMASMQEMSRTQK